MKGMKLPEGWRVEKLGNLATYVNGRAFKPTEWDTKGVPIIRIQNLNKTGSETNYFSGICDKKYYINDEDILVSWSGSLGVFKWNEGEAVLNQHIFKVVFDKIKIEKMYFFYLMKNILKDMDRHTHGSTMKHITKSKFDNIEVVLPQIETQKKIVEVLEKAEKAICKRKEQIELVDELVKSKFIEMFGDPVTNSKEWEREKLNDLGELARGKSKHRPRNAPELLGGPYPLVQTGDISNAGIYLKEYTQTYSEFGLKQSKMWDKGTLCITIAANIAKTSILTFDACFPDSVVAFIPNEKTNNMFIQFWMSFLQKILEDSAPESAQKNINLKILSEQKVIVPPIELQNQFADFVKQVDKLKFEMENSLKELENNFNSLMQRAFRGELFS